MLEAWRLLSNTFECISSGKDIRSDIRVDNEMLLKGTEERTRQFGCVYLSAPWFSRSPSPVENLQPWWFCFVLFFGALIHKSCLMNDPYCQCLILKVFL